MWPSLQHDVVHVQCIIIIHDIVTYKVIPYPSLPLPSPPLPSPPLLPSPPPPLPLPFPSPSPPPTLRMGFCSLSAHATRGMRNMRTSSCHSNTFKQYELLIIVNYNDCMICNNTMSCACHNYCICKQSCWTVLANSSNQWPFSIIIHSLYCMLWAEWHLHKAIFCIFVLWQCWIFNSYNIIIITQFSGHAFHYHHWLLLNWILKQ